MRCTRCGQDAGTSSICPACGGATTAEPVAAAPAAEAAPVVAAPVAESPAIAAATKPESHVDRRGWQQTIIVVSIAIGLGAGAGVLVRKMFGPAPEPQCEKLCEFSDVPVVAANPVWQEQIAEAHCRCNALPKKAPAAKPINHPPPGH